MFLGIWPVKVLRKFSEVARKLSLTFFVLEVVSTHLIMIADRKVQKRDIKGVFLGYHKSTKIAFVLEEHTNRTIRSYSFTGMDSVSPLT